MNLNVLSRPFDYLDENIFRRSDNLVAGVSVFRESMEFDDGTIDEVWKSVGENDDGEYT